MKKHSTYHSQQLQHLPLYNHIQILLLIYTLSLLVAVIFSWKGSLLGWCLCRMPWEILNRVLEFNYAGTIFFSFILWRYFCGKLVLFLNWILGIFCPRVGVQKTGSVRHVLRLTSIRNFSRVFSFPFSIKILFLKKFLFLNFLWGEN